MKSEKEKKQKNRSKTETHIFYMRVVQFSLSVIVLVVSVFLLGRSYGWFAKNRNLSSRVSSLKLLDEEITCSFSLYAYDLNLQRATNSQTVTNSSGVDETILNSLSDFELNTHDAIFEELNEYTMLLVQIDVSGRKINESSSGSLRVMINRSGNRTTSTTLSQVVSNLFSFDAGVCEQIRVLEDVNAKWEKAKEVIEKGTYLTSSAQFISQSGSQYITNKTVSLDMNYTSSDRHVVNGELTVTIFLVIDYSEVYTEKMLNQLNDEFSDFAADRVIPIENDLSDLTVYFIS